MEEALYSHLGFFNTNQVRSDKEGDFLTSPEVSIYFGKIIRNWINSESNLKNIIEIGSGTGSFIEQIGIKEITAVELSSTAREELIKKGIDTHTTIDELTTKTSDLIFGNEILDNIPCSIGLYKDEGWYEKVVLLEENSLAYGLRPIRNEELDWINKNNIVPPMSWTGRSIKRTPTNNTKIPLTMPLTVPPIIYANAISTPDKGAVKRSGNCCKSFICSIDDEVLEDAFVKVFIIIRPGKINIVYDTP